MKWGSGRWSIRKIIIITYKTVIPTNFECIELMGIFPTVRNPEI